MLYEYSVAKNKRKGLKTNLKMAKGRQKKRFVCVNLAFSFKEQHLKLDMNKRIISYL